MNVVTMRLIIVTMLPSIAARNDDEDAESKNNNNGGIIISLFLLSNTNLTLSLGRVDRQNYSTITAFQATTTIDQGRAYDNPGALPPFG